jgi:hypothetical protein
MHWNIHTTDAQHVSARHGCHHQEVFTMVEVVLSKWSVVRHHSSRLPSSIASCSLSFQTVRIDGSAFSDRTKYFWTWVRILKFIVPISLFTLEIWFLDCVALCVVCRKRMQFQLAQELPELNCWVSTGVLISP